MSILGSLKSFVISTIFPVAEYNAAPATLSDGDEGPLQIDPNGNLRVNVMTGAATGPAAAAPADGVANATAIGKVNSWLSGFNGVSWDRLRTGLSGTLTTVTGFLMDIPVGFFNTTPPTLANGNATTLQLDANGSLKVAEQFAPGSEDNSLGVSKTVVAPLASAVYAPSVFVDFGSATAFSIKATQGNLLSVRATNANAALRYLQIHSKASAPVNPNVPVLSIPIAAGTATVPGVVSIGTDFLTANGINLAAGIAIGLSTTAGTYTAATAADHTTNLTYK